MTDLMIIMIYALGILEGIVIGYIIWAPDTAFKRGLVDGLSFKFLWKRK